MWMLPDHQKVTFDSLTMRKYLPIFYERLNGNKPLFMQLQFSHPKIKFAQPGGVGILASYKVGMSIKVDEEGAEELIYDEMRMETRIQLFVKYDYAITSILSHQVEVTNKFGRRSKPIRNSMNMTKNEYQLFLSQFSSMQTTLGQWVSDQFRLGDKLPWSPDEFMTGVNFDENMMHVKFEIEEGASKFFEDEWWDQKAIDDGLEEKMNKEVEEGD